MVLDEFLFKLFVLIGVALLRIPVGLICLLVLHVGPLVEFILLVLEQGWRLVFIVGKDDADDRAGRCNEHLGLGQVVLEVYLGLLESDGYECFFFQSF